MLLIVHQCYLMMLSRKIIVFKPTLQTTNRLFFGKRFRKPLAFSANQATITTNKVFCGVVAPATLRCEVLLQTREIRVGDL